MAITGEFHEDDKLGPIGGKTIVLQSETELRVLMLHEFREAADDARGAATKADGGAASAVHESRKALRRSRAVLELIADALPKSERRAVKKTLQEARRALSSIRDHAVAPDTFGKLILDEQDRVTAKKVLDNAAESMPAIAEVKQLLADSATRAAAQIDALDAALPQELRWSTVVAGVQNVYRAARDARKKAKRSAKSFHAWRRRSKELVYQLKILADHAGARTHAIRDEVSAVTDALGDAVDLLMAHAFVETYGLGIAPDAIARLQDAIQEQVDDLMKSARKAAAGPFEPSAKQFGKRVAKAVRKDLAPIEPAAENHRTD